MKRKRVFNWCHQSIGINYEILQLFALHKTNISIKMMSSYPLHKLRIICLKPYLFPLSMTTIISFQMITSILQFNSIKCLTLHYKISFMLHIRIMSLENVVPIHPVVTCSVSHDIVLLSLTLYEIISRNWYNFRISLRQYTDHFTTQYRNKLNIYLAITKSWRRNKFS